MTNKLVKRCSVPFVLREVQIDPTTRHRFALVRMAIARVLGAQKVTRVDKEMENLDLAGESLKWCRCYGKWCGTSSKSDVCNYHSIQQSGRTQSQDSNRCLAAPVRSSIIHDRQKAEAIQVFVNRRLGKHNMEFFSGRRRKENMEYFQADEGRKIWHVRPEGGGPVGSYRPSLGR